MTSFLSEE